ncbi:hydantoinase/oxoprolinase family protein [Aquamicrobium soli]|uniref:Hydantoinase/oxoprolinase family protein n=1 Tax=Aquamicrobium soli TaxID=1811518 RepID=A0ABV7KBU1_9HYPH
MEKGKTGIAGFDIGGAHLKVARAEAGRVVAAHIFATPLWQGLECLDAAIAEAEPLYRGAERLAFTMTGELVDIFSCREEGVAALIDRIERHFPDTEKLIYTVEAGLVGPNRARQMPDAVASANWHATASLAARLKGEALFVDMGSTTTDILALAGGEVRNRATTDAGRLSTSELVYTGFTRTLPFGVAQTAPVQGRLTPLMNEFFAAMGDVHRILGMLADGIDQHATADGKEKTAEASVARLARMVGRDAAELTDAEWRTVAEWFSERQLRMVHDAAVLVATGLAPDAPVIGAGIGRPQIERLARRMERPYLDFSTLFPVEEAARDEASAAAPATALALLAGMPG